MIVDLISLIVCCRKFGYVDFASEDDLLKALEQNGKKIMGHEVKLDRARSKETAMEGKKGRRATACFLNTVHTCLPLCAPPPEI